MKPFLTLLSLVIFSICYSQGYDDPNTIALPSVNNKFAVSNTSFDVNLYTGVPSINVPIYSLSSKELTIPIGLSYINANGIRVQDVANFVGLGWRLNGSGSVTRVIRGLADEETNGYIGTSQFGNTINTAGASGLTNVILTKIGTGQYDGEPDIFSVTTPFFSFQFVFDQSGNVILPNNNGFKIIHNLFNNSNYTSTSFEIIDDQGNQFFFGSSASSRESVTTKLYTVSTPYVSTWYLDKIITYNGGDQINFSYLQGADYTINHYLSTSTTFTTSPTCSASNIQATNFTQTITYNAPKYLSKVVSSLGEVDLNYLFDRRDFTNAARLVSLAVYPINPLASGNGNILKTYYFNYSYFGDPSTNPDQLRLRLDNIQMSGDPSITPNPTIQIKSFDYNLTKNLPPRNSVSFDYWGYFNSNTSGTSLVPTAIKSPDPNLVSANVLTAIHDISGEIVNFQWEINNYLDVPSQTNINCAGLRINTISRKTANGDNLYTQYIYNDINNKSTGQIYTAIDKSTGLTYSTGYLNFTRYINDLVTTTCGISATNTSSESVYNSYDLNGNFVGYSTVKVLSQNGGYETYSFSNFSDYPDVYLYNNTPSQTYASSQGRQLSSSTSFAYKRGLLQNKTVYKANGDPVSMTQNTYSSLDALSTRGLSVRVLPYTYLLGSITVWVYGTYYTNYENFRLSKAVERTYDQQSPLNYLQKTINYTYSSQDHRLIQTTQSTDSKGNTNTETDFHVADPGIPTVTTTAEINAINWMASQNRKNIIIHSSIARGSINSVTHFTFGEYIDVNSNTKTFLSSKNSYFNTNSLQKQIQYQYDVNNSLATSSNELGGKDFSSVYGYHNSYVKAKLTNALNSTSYTTSQGTQYAYLNIAGGTYGTNSINFTTNYAGSIIVNIPVGSFLGGSGTITISGAFTLTGAASGGGTLCLSNSTGCGNPSSITVPNMPAGNYTMSFSTYTNTVASNNTIQIKVTYPGYLLTVAAQPEFYYEGFEENSGATTSGSAHTGNAYWASNYTFYYTPPNSRSYLIQWWNLTGGKWVFNQQSYTGTSMTLTGPVDDIRIFPADALITTYTYKPLVGITSTTDPSGRSQYFRYDALGRPNMILDNNFNIIKAFDYEYQLLVSPVYNAAQSGPFPKTNCPAGYSGLSFTYTVPANKYSSLISLADANQQAINDVNSNGPAYANSQSNATGCVVNSGPTITCINNTGQIGYTATFTNTVTLQVYTINLPVDQGTISLPAGNYNLTVSTTLTGGIIATFCSSTAVTPGVTQTSVSMTNLTISTTGCLMLTVDSKD